MARRLVQKVSDGRAEWSRQYESRPEQEDVRDHRPIVQGCEHDKSRTEHERTAIVSQSGAVRHPISERSTQGLRKRDRHPIENFYLWRGNGLNIDRTQTEVPG